MAKQKLKAKALLIDLDGTLVDSLRVFDAALESAFFAIGHDPQTDSFGVEIARRLQLDLPLDTFFEKINVDEASRGKFLDVFLKSFYTQATSKTALFPDVEDTLRELSRRFSLALITRRSAANKQVAKELERLRVDGFFKTIITALDVPKPTPSPDALLKAADKLHVPISSCVVVSDSGVDIQAGKRAGAKTVAVLSGLFKEDELVKDGPDRIIESINRLPEYLVPE
jgi:HAD superfamily hydrolase (TIGR01509 family)